MSATSSHNPLFSQLAELIAQALKASPAGANCNLGAADFYGSISTPPNAEMGHYAFPCFILAKACRQSPAQIAQLLQDHFPSTPLVEQSEAQGPYLNLNLSSEALGNLVVKDILSGAFFSRPANPNYPKTMIEYSQPNTHKVLHVGHMRNLCLGNSLVRMHRYLQHPVVAVTYPGDVGTHVAKTLWYMKYHNQKPAPETRKGAWLGELYNKAHIKLEDEKGGPLEDPNRQQLTAILHQLEKKQGEFYDLWVETRQWSLDLMHEAYDWADVSFDRWFYESEMDSPSIELARQMLKDGLLVESEGAVGMDLSQDKLGFCMLIKSDGTGLYATKDVLLAKRKFESFGIQKNIYIVDNRQAHHFKQVFKVLEKMGFEQAKQCQHLQYDVVELPDGAMSSRKGNIIPLMNLVEQMERMIRERYLARYEGQWTPEEIKTTAHMVANGAIKYGMIRIDNNRKIVFDMDEWLKLDGETGPYLQYVHARIVSLGTKLGFTGQEKPDWSVLAHQLEQSLMVKLSLFNNVVEQAAEQSKTMHLCAYLYDLGKLFNGFYVECSIAKAESDELRIARLCLSQAVGKVMRQGLELLGIPAPEKM